MLSLVPLTVAGGRLAAGAPVFSQQRAARPRLTPLLDELTASSLVPLFPSSTKLAAQAWLAARLRLTPRLDALTALEIYNIDLVKGDSVARLPLWQHRTP